MYEDCGSLDHFLVNQFPRQDLMMMEVIVFIPCIGVQMVTASYSLIDFVGFHFSDIRVLSDFVNSLLQRLRP